MKKLLSILSISGIVGSASSTVIACDDTSGDTKKTLSAESVDLSHVTTNFKTSDVYTLARTQIAKIAGITADEIKTGSEASTVIVWLLDSGGNILADDSTAITAGDYTFQFEVKAESTHYNQLAATQVTFTAIDAIDLSSITLGTTVATQASEVYTTIRDKIAAEAGLTADDIKTGSQKDLVLISLWDSTGNVVADDATATPAGDYDVHITVEEGSLYYKKINTATLQITVTATRAVINQNTFAKGWAYSKNLTNADIYTGVRTQIASETGITAADIKSGSEKDSVLLSVWYNGKVLADDATKVMLEDMMPKTKAASETLDTEFDVDVQVTAKSMHYKPVLKPTIFTDNANVTKVALPTSLANVDKVIKASAVYDAIRQQLADNVGIDPMLIKTKGETEYNAISIALYYDGKLLKDDATVLDGTKSLVGKMIVKDSAFYSDAGTAAKPATINIQFNK